MAKLILTMVAIAISSAAYSQQEFRAQRDKEPTGADSAKTPKSEVYIAAGAGISLISQDIGLVLNLLNVGWAITERVGLCLNWMGTGHASQTPRREFGYGTLMIGPMLRLPMSEKDFVDVKARVGTFYYREEEGSLPVRLRESREIGYSLALTYGYRIGRHGLILLSTDYYSGKTAVPLTSGRVTGITVHGGVGLRF